MFGNQDTGRTVLSLVEEWIPEKAYRSETKFQNDLKEFLNDRLNSGGGGILGQNRTYAVRREYGKSNADVAVDDMVGIELKRDVTNGKTRRLESQINDYREEFPYTIVCACGIEEFDRWNQMKQRYEGQQGMGLGMNTSQVWFVHKKKENFGKAPTQNQSRGLFGGSAFDGDLDDGFGGGLF